MTRISSVPACNLINKEVKRTSCVGDGKLKYIHLRWELKDDKCVSREETKLTNIGRSLEFVSSFRVILICPFRPFFPRWSGNIPNGDKLEYASS
ncbi:unnamed protein product [Protopolystoma xenopodis]|uniref:Uncharacterized protein n=1 Tax=Protopolystoma xenopodis TaxID=117903 RepID=A0A3S5C5H1_9PLAT|nr:unnamed protein product [Protopolystoma xenopodis]